MAVKTKKLYITTESREKLRKKFLNFRFYFFISIDEIIKSLGEDPDNLTDNGIFLVNNSIIEGIDTCLKRKKHIAIIYSNPNINYNIIKNLQERYADNEYISSLSLLDDKHNPKHEDIWSLFEEVVFFPSVTKKKINDCKSITNLERHTY